MSSDGMIPFLERAGGVAPDLIGFGRSGKGGHLDYSPSGLLEFVERFVDELELAPTAAVGHGWGGAVALLLGLREPERFERLVLIDAVPLLPGFRWPAAVRLWRRPVVGELLMGSTTRRLMARQLRRGSTRPQMTWNEARIGTAWAQFDQGTQRALLRLHRAADEAWLAGAGEAIDGIQARTLIVWGDADPWLPPAFADAYASRLPGAEVEHCADAGHWPWLDEPGLVGTVVEFLGGR
jgi:pimeloyl-ACP methyl ester carboxylesterase